MYNVCWQIIKLPCYGLSKNSTAEQKERGMKKTLDCFCRLFCLQTNTSIQLRGGTQHQNTVNSKVAGQKALPYLPVVVINKQVHPGQASQPLTESMLCYYYPLLHVYSDSGNVILVQTRYLLVLFLLQDVTTSASCFRVSRFVGRTYSSPNQSLGPRTYFFGPVFHNKWVQRRGTGAHGSCEWSYTAPSSCSVCVCQVTIMQASMEEIQW